MILATSNDISLIKYIKNPRVLYRKLLSIFSWCKQHIVLVNFVIDDIEP